MSEAERAKVRQAGAEDARRSRRERGLPEQVEDPAAIAILVALLRSTRPQAKEAAQGHEGKPAA